MAQSQERGPIRFPLNKTVDTAKKASDLPVAAGAELLSSGPFSGVPLPGLGQPTDAIGGAFDAGFGSSLGGGASYRSNSSSFRVGNLHPTSQAALREAGEILFGSPYVEEEDIAALSYLALALQPRDIGKVNQLVTAAAETIRQIRFSELAGEYSDGSPVGTDCVIASFKVLNLNEVELIVLDRGSAPNLPVRVDVQN